MVLFTDMLQHLQMLFIFTKRFKVSMICGSQNMNSIMRYDITFSFGSLQITVLSYCPAANFRDLIHVALLNNYS